MGFSLEPFFIFCCVEFRVYWRYKLKNLVDLEVILGSPGMRWEYMLNGTPKKGFLKGSWDRFLNGASLLDRKGSKFNL